MTMDSGFLKQIIDSVSEHIVVIDADGEIIFVNRAWACFGQDNGMPIPYDSGKGNYLAVCQKAASAGDEFGIQASAGIRSVMAGNGPFYLEYPCHSPDEKRWFMMSVNAFRHEDSDFFVISHKDITERKLLEEKALELARLDGLTGVANRRHFDQFLHHEWKRCARLQQPIALAMIDIDFFKQINDTYGHQYGDDCLVKISQVLQRYAKRPGDLCARYGGEEFVIVFGISTAEQMLPLLQKLQDEIRALHIPNEPAGLGRIVTVSMGVATAFPQRHSDERTLIEAADSRLYAAKRAGRNRIEAGAA